MNAPLHGAPPPPLPGRAPSPRPKKSYRGCLIAAAIAAVCGIVLLGILAAIALPAYKEYVTKSKVAMASSEAFIYKLEIAAFQVEHERCPMLGDEDFNDPSRAQLSPERVEVEIGEAADGSCTIDLTLRDTSPELSGKSLHYRYDADAGAWLCSSPDIEDRLLPHDCRG